MSKLQITLAIIKPHVVKNPVALNYIRNVIKKRFIIVKTKSIHLDSELACNFYREHFGKFFFNRLVTFMASGSSDIHILAHKNSIKAWRALLGPTKVYKAQFEEPNSLRGMFGLSDTRNVAHGSDSEESARKEIGFFFPEFDVEQWYRIEEPQLRIGPLKFNMQLFQHYNSFRVVN